MSFVTRKLLGFAAAASLVAAVGCDGGPSTPSASLSKEEATVSGSVTVKGAPATGGEIVFDPQNIYRKDAAIKTAPIGANGSFTIKTLVGENAVTVKGPDIDKDRSLAGFRKVVEVKSGENVVPISVGEAK